jgi:hypothetical protein
MGNFWKKVFSSIFGTKNYRPNKVKVIIPHHKPLYDGPLVKNYGKLKKTYRHTELSPEIKGRRVKSWLKVYTADDIEGDEYIPIFFKRRKHKSPLHPRR